MSTKDIRNMHSYITVEETKDRGRRGNFFSFSSKIRCKCEQRDHLGSARVKWGEDVLWERGVEWVRARATLIW